VNRYFREINRRLGLVGLLIVIITSCSQKDDLPFKFYIENYSLSSIPVVPSTQSQDLFDTVVKIKLSVTNVSETPWTISVVDVRVRPRIKNGNQWDIDEERSFWTVVDSLKLSEDNRDIGDWISLREIQPSQTIIYYGVLKMSEVKKEYKYPLEKIRIQFTQLTQDNEKEEEDVMSSLESWVKWSEGEDIFSPTYRQEIIFDCSGLEKVGEIVSQDVYEVGN
jgi:hypothetical protein